MDWLLSYLKEKNVKLFKKVPREILFRGEPGEYFEALLKGGVSLHIYNYLTNKVVIIIDNQTLWEYNITTGLMETRTLDLALSHAHFSHLLKRELVPVTLEAFKEGVRKFIEVPSK